MAPSVWARALNRGTCQGAGSGVRVTMGPIPDWERGVTWCVHTPASTPPREWVR